MEELVKEPKKRGRKKGSKNAPKSKLNKWNKLTIYITGKEKDAFDFKPLVESAYRIAHDYISYRPIIRKITNPIYWKNVEWIKSTLSEYVNMEVREKEIKAKRKYTKKIKETV